jgi:hypothetical protein
MYNSRSIKNILILGSNSDITIGLIKKIFFNLKRIFFNNHIFFIGNKSIENFIKLYA